MRVMSKEAGKGNGASKRLPPDPPLLGELFTNPAFGVLWLIVRVFVGWQWLQAGLEKLENPQWLTTGAPLQAFWQSAVVVPDTGHPPITYDWYRSFLTYMLNAGHYVWFSKLVVCGEIAIGIALIIGAFVGVAALFGAFMNLNFMLAGSASINPVLFTLAIFLILAWKVAGYWGLDHILLPTVQTPWQWAGKGHRTLPSPQAS